MKTILKKEQVALYIFENNIQDLDKIDFLKKNLEKELYVKSVDDINMTITVSEYENSKSFTFPASLFLQDIQQEEEETPQDEIVIHETTLSKFIQNINPEKIIIWILTIFSILLLLFSTYNKNLTADVTTPPVILSESDILTDKSINNTKMISQELQEQKRLRNLLSESITKVKTLEKENQEIRNTLIHKAQ